ncbi:hypothetical protein QP968_00555 [Corynebacterium sp. MSK041]|uniref:hypothetical protein n=1 Tax=Corynebacterium sp. MSK041 TaxID=3050194 RepID=UPI00254F2ECD|nr:hypothetical protein [Corynebacterium sp. MSK041]MDK8794203.1 hypothetical protein [Corynebacterium sp. MSK041]
MNKPSIMPPHRDSFTALEEARQEHKEWFADTYGDHIDDVKALMDAFTEYDDRTAAMLVQAVIMLTPEEQ